MPMEGYLEAKEQKKIDESKKGGLFINKSQREEAFQVARVGRGRLSPGPLIFNW